jgi:hypothetical protein
VASKKAVAGRKRTATPRFNPQPEPPKWIRIPEYKIQYPKGGPNVKVYSALRVTPSPELNPQPEPPRPWGKLPWKTIPPFKFPSPKGGKKLTVYMTLVASLKPINLRKLR